ncbi:MAG: DEAD/DEAH box helicase [Spirochaetaceae bacterium]|nr:DEAD/DEAH box helicase [Spirochaetaceae bacterium]
MEFTEFSLDPRLLKGIEEAGYVSCTPVQEQVIKASKNDDQNAKEPDLYVQSQTGTGKTAAYLVAVINAMLAEKNVGKKCLVLVPTRELAVQVEEEAKVLVGDSGLKAFSVYGGVGYEKQIANLKKGVDILIGTPGRVIDLIEGKNLDLSTSNFVVIDEADRMFDMGFYPDLRTILKCLPEAEVRQTMLFSATLNSYVKNLAWEYTRDPIEITIEAENITVSEIQQELLHVSSDEKMKLLIGVLKHDNPESVIIFCNTKRSCEVVAKRLQMNDIKCDFLIGDLPQSKRLQILKQFKASEIKVLVATDVAARGIDVDDLAMVINYDLPVEAENYVHRIGRTARAGKSGKAYTFCSEQDVYNLPAIERYVEMSIPSSVAYPEQMEEDKSAGVYIKTENWHGDDENESRGGYKKGGKYSSGKGNGNYKGGKAYNRDDKGYKKGDYKKGGKGGSYKKYDDKGKVASYRKPAIDTEKLANLSYEERMKMYKETYGKSFAKGAKNNSNYKNKNKGNYNSKNKNYNQKQNVQKNTLASKKSLWQKIKEFFNK